MANDTRQDAIAAQRATQYSTATDQLSSSTPDVQLGAIYSLEALVVDDREHYSRKGCELIRVFIDTRAPRTDKDELNSNNKVLNVAVLGALNVAGLTCGGQTSMTFTGLNLEGARMPDASLHKLRLPNANLKKADLARSNMSDGSLPQASFIRADLSESRLVGADLTRADLSYAHLSGADLSSAKLNGVVFDYADLSFATLQDARAGGDASLKAAILTGANLQGAQLTEASLVGAHLVDANLREADLARSDLRDANLRDADLRDADLTGARLDGADVTGISSNENTRWPVGYSVPS